MSSLYKQFLALLSLLGVAISYVPAAIYAYVYA
jgi:hypothetical protein